MTTLRTDPELYNFKGNKSKVNSLTNGTPGSSLSPTQFNMVINQLLQLNLGSKVQIIAYADDLAINGGPIGDDILYKQMTTALKKIGTKSMQLGLKFSPNKCEAIWYRSNDPDWNFKIAGEKNPWRASVKYPGVIIDKRLNFRNLFKLEETQILHYTLQSTGDNEINGPLRYRNVTDSHQANWRNKHNYKETTPPHGNNYHTNVG